MNDTRLREYRMKRRTTYVLFRIRRVLNNETPQASYRHELFPKYTSVFFVRIKFYHVFYDRRRTLTTL